MPICLTCAATTAEDDRFCGECGAALVSAEAAGCVCGAPAAAIDAGGFCRDCGRGRDAEDPHDHAELVLSADFAGVTDRGRRHKINEDALLIAEIPGPAAPVRLLVVSDGVSSSSAADQASGTAVEAVREASFAAIAAGASLRQALAAGVEAAQKAVCALAFPASGTAPAATLVAALVEKRLTAVAWIGDSRAYCLAPTPLLLTRDDSWINDIVAAGALTLEAARRHAYAHAITACLGRLDDGEAFRPHIEEHELPEGTILLLCSDGLWNYAEAPEALAGLLPANTERRDALTLCRDLVARAIAEGGHDNVTVAIIRLKVTG